MGMCPDKAKLLMKMPLLLAILGMTNNAMAYSTRIDTPAVGQRCYPREYTYIDGNKPLPVDQGCYLPGAICVITEADPMDGARNCGDSNFLGSSSSNPLVSCSLNVTPLTYSSGSGYSGVLPAHDTAFGNGVMQGCVDAMNNSGAAYILSNVTKCIDLYKHANDSYYPVLTTDCYCVIVYHNTRSTGYRVSGVTETQCPGDTACNSYDTGTGTCVNFKPYAIIETVPQILRRKFGKYPNIANLGVSPGACANGCCSNPAGNPYGAIADYVTGAPAACAVPSNGNDSTGVYIMTSMCYYSS